MLARFTQTVILLLFATIANTQVSQNMTLVGNWNPGGFPTSGSLMYNDIWGYADCSGNEYAIMGGAAFYHFIDITNPSNPTEVTSIEGGNTTIWRDIKTYSKYAYGVCDSCNEGLSVFDMGDLPNSVTMVGQYTGSFTRAHNIFIDEDNARLYAVGTNTQGNGIIVFDLAADPANPPEIARTSLPSGYIHDIFVRNNIGYANSGNNGMYVYDFTNMSNVITLGSLTGYTPSGYNHAGWVTDDNQGYVFADETHNRDLKYCDISDLSNITITSLFRSALLAPGNTQSVAHNPFIRDNYAIVSYYHDGLQVFDISDPNNIVQTAWYDTYTGHSNYNGFSGNWGAYPFLPSGNILASDEFTGLYILNPTNITFTPIATPPPPTVSINAAGATNFCEGNSVDLNATYSGTSVQWYQNGTAIVGATSNTFTATEAGDYYAQTMNSACSANSTSIQVTIMPEPDATLNVGNFNQICEGEDFQITAPAGEPSYNWTRDGSPIASNTNSIIVSEAGAYQVEISNGSCSTSSIIANLNVETTPDATLNVSGDQELCEGDVFNLFVAGGANTYQWTKDNAPFAGNTSTITISEPGTYQVTAINGDCDATSAEVPITIVSYPDVILNENDPIQLCNNESAILEIAEGADSYTWYKDGNIVVGTSNIISVFESGFYHVEATNSNCTAISESIPVEVGEDPDVSLNVPTQNTICEGDILEIEIPTGADTYTWYYNNAIQSTTANNFIATNDGNYYVVADINGCTATSENVNITVQQYPDANINAPSFNEICEGDDFILSAPNGAQNYQWYRDNILFAAAGNTVFVNEPGDYYLAASNGDCVSVSQTVTLAVQSAPDVTLNTSGTIEICEGESLNLSIPAGAQNYNWMLNGNQTIGNSSNISVSESGTYQVIASNGNCEAISENVTVTIRQYPSTNLNVPLQNEICDGASLDINVPSGADTYQWFLNGNDLGNATNAITATQAGNYQVIASNGNCEVFSDMVNLTVNATPSVELNVPNFNQICEGETVTLTIPNGAANYTWFENGMSISNNTNTITVSNAGMYEVTAGNGTCEATSEMVEIAVNAYPAATLNVPLQNEICAGETIELSIPAGAATYQWYQDGNLLSQTNNSITTSNSGNYQVIAMNGDCATTSEMVNVQVTDYPNVDLSVPLQNQICEGEILPISVATGANDYQWFLDGNPIATTAEIMATTAGNYTVTASNGSCEITSETLELTILTYPDVDLDGETTNDICAGESVTIGIEGGAQTYQWYQNGNLLSENGNTITTSESGNYQVIAANGNCEVTSEMVNVQVFDYPEATIDVPLQNELCEGQSLTITLPTGAQNYEWYQNGDLMTATTETITVSAAGNYYAVLANGDCTTTSETVALMITPLPNVELSVGSMNQICQGDQLTIENLGNADNYQWYQNGELLSISGNAITVSEPGNYQLISTNGECAASSEIITVEVVDAPDSNLNVGTDNEICAGETLVLEVAAGASNYQWFLNGEMTGNNEATLNATVAGEYFVMIGSGDCSSTSATINLTVTALPDAALNVENDNVICAGDFLNIAVAEGATDYTWYYNNEIFANDIAEINTDEAGEYYVIISNGNCETTSEIVEISTVEIPDATLNYEDEVMICANETIEVIAPTGAENYQWFLDGELISEGTPTLIPTESGIYTMQASNGDCIGYSEGFNLEIIPLPNPQLSASGTQSICEGETFNVSVPNNAESYQWFFNGVPVGDDSFEFSTTEAGEYYVVANNGSCSEASELIFLYVNPFPSADIQTTAVQICPGEIAILSTPSFGQSFQWFVDGEPIAGANDSELEVSDAGTYSLSVTENGCTAVSVNLQINVLTPIVPEVSFDGEILTASPADTYQWFLNGDPIMDATDQTYIPMGNGDYNVQITDTNGCEATSETVTVLIDAVQDVALSNNVLLYPNPTKAAIYLNYQSEELLIGQLVIFNNIGQTVFEQDIHFNENLTKKMDVDNWASGVYFLKIVTEDGRFISKKFIKE